MTLHKTSTGEIRTPSFLARDLGTVNCCHVIWRASSTPSESSIVVRFFPHPSYPFHEMTDSLHHEGPLVPLEKIP